MTAEDLGSVRYDDPEPLRLVTLARTDGPYEVLAEATDNPHLVIVPARRKAATRWQWCGWSVAHVPTGRQVPPLGAADIEVVRRAAALVADLDWSSADPATYRDDVELARRCRQARRQSWDDYFRAWDDTGDDVAHPTRDRP